MKKLFTYILFMLLQGIVLAQTMPADDYINQTKYWFYRNRLINEFCKVGPNQGESIPFQSIDYANAGTMASSVSIHYAYSGDGGLQKLGDYIAVLASEIKLLRNSGQNVSKTVEELFYALYAAKRLDITAETYNYCYSLSDLNNGLDNAKKPIYPYLNPIQCSGGSPNENGWMIRDDKNPNPGPFLSYFQNMTGTTNIGSDFGRTIPPYRPSTFKPTNDLGRTYNDVSHDQLIELFFGLRMVQIFLDGTETYFFQGTTYNLKQYSTNIASTVITYMANGSFINNPADCNYVKNFMEVPTSISALFSPLLQSTTGTSCSSSSVLANTSTQKFAWLFNNAVTLQPSSIQNEVGASFPFYMSAGYAELGNKLTGQTYFSTAIAKTVWNKLGTVYKNNLYSLNDNWKVLALASMTDSWNGSSSACGVIQDYCNATLCVPYPIVFLRKGCMMNIPLATKILCNKTVLCTDKQSIMYDQCLKAHYEILALVYNVINNKTDFISATNSSSMSAYTSFFQDHISNAPCRGPYCNGPNDLAGGGWASWNMFHTPGKKGDVTLRTSGAPPDPQNGNRNSDWGEYNGLDYMLMYNLYNINNNTNNYYVNYHNNLSLTNRTITGPEYYNARSFTDNTGYTGNKGTVFNGVITASSITVNSGAYLNLRAGSSITISPPFTVNGSMQATIYRPTDNTAWEMNICNNGMLAQPAPQIRETSTASQQNYISMSDYNAAQPLVNQTSNLGDSYPNPAIHSTKIPYTIAAEEAVEIFIIDASGSKVATLVKKESHAAGDFTIDYSTNSLNPGVYYYTLKTSSYSKTKKLVILN